MIKIKRTDNAFHWPLIKRGKKALLLMTVLSSFQVYSQTDSLSTPASSPPAETQPTPPVKAQVGTKEIKGKITSKDGEPLMGVVIAIKGTSLGTTTDENGEFALKVPEEHADKVLVVQLLGYKKVEFPLATTSSFDVVLEEEGTAMDEVVIIGYGTQEKEDVTGSIATVKAADLSRVVVVDPVQAIQGRAPGVNVTQNTGAPGAPLTVQVRGVGTINNSVPLYVVNGIPVGGDISYLHANDIASIDILKDGSACAVYGSRAANGVILITTKSGSAKKTAFDFNALFGISNAWKHYNLTNAQEWTTLANEASMADKGTAPYNPSQYGQGTNWQDQIFRQALMQSYSLAASGGTEKSTYYFSGGYLSQDGILKNSSYNRATFNTRMDHQLFKRLKVGTTINAAFSNRAQLYDGDPDNSIIANALTITPLNPIYSGNPPYAEFASDIPRSDVPNPMARLTYYTNKFKGLNFLGNWFGEYELMKGLKLKSSLGYVINSVTNDQFNGQYYVSSNEQNPNSTVINTQTTNKNTIWENSLNFQRTFAEKHKIGALLLMGMQDFRYDQFRASKTITPSNDPSVRYQSTATGVASTTGTGSESTMLSYLFRVDYEYKNKYLLTANMRRDASSKFPVNNRWGSFPSFAVGWKVSEEDFFEPLKSTISFLKLRASWGKLGNSNFIGGDYPYTTNIVTGYNYAFNNASANGSTPLAAGNPNLKWETVTTSNLGVDFGFFQNKLLFSVDYFTKKTTDMIIRQPIPYYIGSEQPPFVNGPEMSNKGWEFYTEYRNQVGQFHFRVTGNFTTIKNQVTKLGDPIYAGQSGQLGYVNITQQGSAIAQFYGYETNGIVQTQSEADALQKEQPGVKPGDFKFKDLDGDGVITQNDRTTLGSPLPKFTYGFSGEVSFKGFDLVLFFQGVQGNKIFNAARYRLDGGVPFNNLDNQELNRWTGPGTSNDVPRMTFNDVNGNRRASNYYIEDGSYLRLKTCQLGYTIPDAYTQKIKMQKVRVFVGAQNLLTFTKYSGLDPEIGTYTPDFSYTPSFLDIGIDHGGTYPQARTFQFGLNASF
jgi:TonB-linked SusC/RagA family outer membrane protein